MMRRDRIRKKSSCEQNYKLQYLFLILFFWNSSKKKAHEGRTYLQIHNASPGIQPLTSWRNYPSVENPNRTIKTRAASKYKDDEELRLKFMRADSDLVGDL
jgi:hypothetical protein